MSEVEGSRSEAAAQSKDPFLVGADGSLSRRFRQHSLKNFAKRTVGP
jgi:hypothetical protein